MADNVKPGKTKKRRAKMPSIKLEAGTSGGYRVWVGAPPSCYDFVRKPVSGEEMHILSFTCEQAEAVIEMLRTEIDRLRGCIGSFDCNAGDHSDVCPAEREKRA